MHGLIFETSVCYWQNQPGCYLFKGKARSFGDVLSLSHFSSAAPRQHREKKSKERRNNSGKRLQRFSILLVSLVSLFQSSSFLLFCVHGWRRGVWSFSFRLQILTYAFREKQCVVASLPFSTLGVRGEEINEISTAGNLGISPFATAWFSMSCLVILRFPHLFPKRNCVHFLALSPFQVKKFRQCCRYSPN